MLSRFNIVARCTTTTLGFGVPGARFLLQKRGLVSDTSSGPSGSSVGTSSSEQQGPDPRAEAVFNGELGEPKAADNVPLEAADCSTASLFSSEAVDAEIVSFSQRIFSFTGRGAQNLELHETVSADKRIEKRQVRSVGADEGLALEMQRLKAGFEQKGAFGGLHRKDVMVNEVDNRKRRVTTSVPFVDPLPRVANETSFRRLPKNYQLPKEAELRALYPMTTGLVLSMGEAHCADANAADIDKEPEPIKYVKLLPKDYDKNRCYPHLVVLADGRGMPIDFEDVCANFFERPMVAQGLKDGEWVVFCPAINVKISWHKPQEAIVARFCDWVVANHNVENGRVHLFGKGYGAFCAVRTCLEHANVALSVVALFGRGGTPYRVQDNARNKIKNLDGVHVLTYTPGLLWKQDWIYKFKYMMDESNNRPAMRNIHYEGVFDHQLYYAVNPTEFWNYLNFFRRYNYTMLTDGSYRNVDEAVRQEALDAVKRAKESRGEATGVEDEWSFYSPPAFTQEEISRAEVTEISDADWEVKFGDKDDVGGVEYQGDVGEETGRPRRSGLRKESGATSL